MFLPVGLRLVSRLARSPRLLLLELFASFQFRLAAFTGLRFSSSCTCLVSSGTAASRMFECGLALSGLGGCSPLGVLPPRFPLAACFPYGWLVQQLGGLPPIFSLTFSFGVVVAPWFLVGILQRFSPPGGFLLQFFLRVSCLRSGGGGFGWLSLAGPCVLRDVFPWCLFASILFPSCATRGRFDVLGVLVSGSGLSASACSHACGRFRGIALGPGAGFPFVSLPGGRVV